jgi:phosphoglycerate dehydrogenase-like enzyme
MKSILVSESRQLRAYSDATLASLRSEAGLSLRPLPFTRAEILAGEAADAEAAFSSWGMPALTADEIAEHLPRLTALFYAAGSVQSFARPFLERGIRVYSAWRENAVPVAEVAVSQILLANKGFFQACRRFRSRDAHAGASQYFSTFPGNFDCRVGLLGCGGVGSLVARALRAHRLEVLVFDPFLPDAAAAALGVRKAPLEEIFHTCQTISNHLANNAQTTGMLGYALFSAMPCNATFINTGRGAQVVEADLARALEEAPARTAVLDVTWPEPPEVGSPLFSLPNVFLTPHFAGSSGNEVCRMGEAMLDEFRAWRENHSAPSSREVSLEMLETMA